MLGHAARGPLALQDVAVGYGSSFHMSGISFETVPGDIVGIIGPNGAGKSTLLKAIAGVRPLTAGRITLDGRSLASIQGRLAFVPQREDVNWDFPATALDVVLMARNRNIGWFRRAGDEDRRVAEYTLARMGLEGMGQHHISEFSGGQQQRIFLARALAQEPMVVLLDEPFTGVDTSNRAIIHDVVRELAEGGVIVLMATHDLQEVSERTTALACINRGLIVYGPSAATYTPQNLRATFGGQVAVFQ